MRLEVVHVDAPKVVSFWLHKPECEELVCVWRDGELKLTVVSEVLMIESWTLHLQLREALAVGQSQSSAESETKSRRLRVIQHATASCDGARKVLCAQLAKPHARRVERGVSLLGARLYLASVLRAQEGEWL